MLNSRVAPSIYLEMSLTISDGAHEDCQEKNVSRGLIDANKNQQIDQKFYQKKYVIPATYIGFPHFRRARSQGAGPGLESGFRNAPPPAYSGTENAFPPSAPAYGADSMMDRMAVGAARGAAEAAMQKSVY